MSEAFLAILRGLEIAIEPGYEPVRAIEGYKCHIVSPDGASEPLSIQRLAKRDHAQAILRWSGIGTVVIEFVNEAGSGGITLTNLLPPIAARMKALSGEDFALHAAEALREICPAGFSPEGPDQSGIVPIGREASRRNLQRARAVMAACSVANTELDVIEATQTITWEDGLPTLCSVGTTRDGGTVEAVPLPIMAEILSGLEPVVTAKLRPPLPNVDHPTCPNYMIRDDLEAHPPLDRPEDRIRAIREGSKAAGFLGIPPGQAVFEVRLINDEQ